MKKVAEKVAEDKAAQAGAGFELILNAIKNPITRRRFLQGSALTVVAIAGADLLAGCGGKKEPQPAGGIIPAKGMVVADETLCGSCRRCELVCSYAHNGAPWPALARLTVDRKRAQFALSTGLFKPETCHMCDDPACVKACPTGAAHVAPKGEFGDTYARVIDVEKCVGCRSCEKACPFRMIVFNEQAKKSLKCDLCGGQPRCVKECPASALTFVPFTAKA
ncbi:MAG TPA: 4Fe-4S dicluster domain-containing protein [Firmicutes bacterium]|nr:4Fe-4S dicluster domain-containing protein [Bacillota bacterium]